MKINNSLSNTGPVRPLLRSLLQKAVRRGYANLVQEVICCLASRGDSAWLHARTGVIVFEECWTCAHFLNDGIPSAVTLANIAAMRKNKDAAGLGSLAYAASEGDLYAIKKANDPIAVKIVAAALKRPDDFFKWAIAECNNEEQLAVVHASQRFISRASWPWDKAFMVAGAYLSCQGNVPKYQPSEHLPLNSFPYWVAVDKHTPQGRAALRRVSSDLDISLRILEWVSFYFESAVTNELTQSSWWGCESRWRFDSLGLTLEAAEDIWAKASSSVESTVKVQSDLLCELINSEGLDNNGGGFTLA